jgi:hypothetical protein
MLATMFPASRRALLLGPLPLLLLSAPSLAGPLRAQPAPASTAVAAPAAPAVELPHLLMLPDPAAPVRYAPGSLDRASHAQDWLRELAATAATRTRRAVPLRAVVLPREDWEKLGTGQPYGLPLVSAAGVLALPAAGDPGTVALWRDAVAELPAIAGNPLLGTVEEAASVAAADFVAAPAAGRVLATAGGLAVEEPWLADLLGHMLALDAAYQERLGRADAMLAFWRGIRRSGRARAATSPLAAELLRHAALAGAAEAILGSERRVPGKALRKMQERSGGVLREADLRAAWPRPFEVLDETLTAAR